MERLLNLTKNLNDQEKEKSIILKQPIDLEKIDNYAYRILSPIHKSETMNLLVDSFIKRNPLVTAFYIKYPELDK